MGSDRTSRWRSEEGNTLILMPVAVVIVLGLAGLAVDSSLGFRAQRELEDLAAGIANDAVTALDLDAFYGVGGTPALVLDQARMDTIVAAAEGASNTSEPSLAARCTAEPVPGTTEPTIEVQCTGIAEAIFFRMFGRDEIPVSATARATLAEG